MKSIDELKYPIGQFVKPTIITQKHLDKWIEIIEVFTKGLTVEQLNWAYRPKGWNIKQVIHHCADSHMNSLIRFKLALTEETPIIRPYFEDRWANLIDSNNEDLNDTLMLLKGLHSKLGLLLKHISDKDLKREFIHPEHGRHFSLDETIGIYAWHCNHHYEHIKQALHYKGKF